MKDRYEIWVKSNEIRAKMRFGFVPTRFMCRSKRKALFIADTVKIMTGLKCDIFDNKIKHFVHKGK